MPLDHVCTKEDDIVEIKRDVKDIKKVINGNGELGLAAKTQLLYQWMERADKSKNGLLDWCFRIAISLILAYIAHEVGLK